MEVFIGNLSPRTTLTDLVTFFKGFASDTRFQIFDKQYDDGSRTRYAVASIDSDRVAEKAIKKLTGKVLNGNTIMLREYQHRSYGNERRAVGWRDKPWHGIERRASERRRKQAVKQRDFDTEMGVNKTQSGKEESEEIRIEARGNFARKY